MSTTDARSSADGPPADRDRADGSVALGKDTHRGAGDGSSFEAVQATEEFQHLKRTLRRFVFPATAVFLGWYLLYVLASGFARDFMATEVFGVINVAYLFGLLQFVSTFVIAWVYSRYAEKHFDPTADAIRHRLEGTR